MQNIKWKGRDLCDRFAFKANYKKYVFLQKHIGEHAAVYETAFLDSI